MFFIQLIIFNNKFEFLFNTVNMEIYLKDYKMQEKIIKKFNNQNY